MSKQEVILSNGAGLSEKDSLLISENSYFSSATIVGGGADEMNRHRERSRQKYKEQMYEKLRNIEGLNFTAVKDSTLGKEQLKAIIQNEILFDFNSHNLSYTAKNMLNHLANILVEMENPNVKIIGHTDNVGAMDYNQLLSQNRASAVGNVLRERGVDPTMITEFGKGYSQPIASNGSAAGRAKNRRVEIYISIPEI